ncbi:L-threonine aldolase [Breoghania corrubedonensis]|uniref:L-threonine aldolase n=1 Tax=Breoghania corrubedonensis TaxID=665038 RepID=A0A2T5VI61_9HYPH|nr:GntG family PLP-dependent aldolase [Breoghania corrubedonensis]PTW63406.1 L-threonine aldolase [Breoghania corrubedonensis]
MTSAIEIDLVSDTTTRPSADMLTRMASAPVGDEQKNEDPTTLALNEEVAGLLGMEAAVFLPSGTMCNQISFLVHCRPGDEIIAAENAHVVASEGAGAAALAGAQMRPIATPTGIFEAADVLAALRAPRMRSPRSSVVSVEQTSNRGGGLVWPVETLAALVEAAHANGLAAHMDGARLMNAAVAADTPAKTFARGFDSAWIDLSKGLGCPVGAVLAGSKDFIAAAWGWKHRLGGALRQSGVLAAAGLYALEHNVERMAEDHANAKLFADLVTGLPHVTVSPREVMTNILFLELDGPLTSGEIVKALAERGVRIGAESDKRMRVVTHLDASEADVRKAAEVFTRVIEGLV